MFTEKIVKFALRANGDTTLQTINGVKSYQYYTITILQYQ